MNLPDDCDRYSYDVVRCEPPRLRYWCALVGADKYKARCDRPDSSFRSSQCHFLTLPIKVKLHTLYAYYLRPLDIIICKFSSQLRHDE